MQNSKGIAWVGVASGLLALGLTGCESSPGGSGGSGGSGRSMTAAPVAHDAWAALGYRLDWQGFAPVSRGARVTHVALAPDFLILQEGGSTVSVLEKNDGSLRWTNQLGTRLTKFTGLHAIADTVYATSQSELIGMNAATGAITSRQRFQRVVNTPPLVQGSVALYGTATGEVLGHLMTNGVKLWGFMTPGAIDFGAVDINGIAGIASQSGDVTFLDPQTGTLYGRQRMFDGTTTAPVAGDGAMYVASLDQSLWAFEPGGIVRWRYRTEHALRAQPVFHNGSVYCEIPGQGLVCLDARTGTRRWASQDAAGTVVAQRQGMLVVFNDATTLLVDSRDGTLVRKESIPDVAMIVAEGFTDGPIYAISRTGSVSRFIPRR